MRPAIRITREVFESILPIWCVVPAALCWLAAATFAAASTPTVAPASASVPSTPVPTVGCSLRPGDEIWVIDSRCPGSCCAPLEGLRIGHLAGSDTELPPTLQALTATRDDCRTFFFVHGYNYSAQDAIQAGYLVYQHLIACPIREPIRLVIWIWSSERTGRWVADVQAKSQLADVESARLAAVLRHFATDQRIGMLGYSLGARIITGALQRLALAGTPPARPSGEPTTTVSTATVGMARVAHSPGSGRAPRPNVLLIAAAIDNWWLLPGQVHGLAATHAQQLTVLVNRHDPALKRYHWTRRGSVQALGFTGVSQPGAIHGNYRQYDVTPAVGRNHRLHLYLSSAAVRQHLLQL